MHPKALLDSLGIRARKSLSQNFLTSPHWVETLVGAVLEGPEVDEYWEVGPGLGALTEKLVADAPKPVRLFEYDRALAAHLRNTYPQTPLREGDFLTADLEGEFAQPARVGFLSNVPYHLSSPILFKLLPHRHRFPRLVMTFQREFADRLSAKPRTSDYAGLTVMIQTFFELAPLGVLPPGAFYPKPGVDSFAVTFTPRPAPGVDPQGFETFIRTAFRHRRKQLAGNLKGWRAEPWTEWLQALGHPTDARPEALSPADFQALWGRLASE